jgi:hypothetical protein
MNFEDSVIAYFSCKNAAVLTIKIKINKEAVETTTREKRLNRNCH